MFTNIQPNVFSSGAGGSLSQAFSVAGSVAANTQSSQTVQSQLSSVVASQIQGVSVSLSKQGVQLSQAVSSVKQSVLSQGNEFPPNILKKTASDFPPNYLKQGANLASSILKKEAEDFPPNYLRKNTTSALKTKSVEEFPPDYVKQAQGEFPEKLSGKAKKTDFPPNYLKENQPLKEGVKPQNLQQEKVQANSVVENRAAKAYQAS